MDLLVPLLVDAPAAFVVGSIVDAISQETGALLTGPDSEGTTDDITSTSLMAVKLGVQMFTQLSIMSKYSELMYANTDSTDPTNGFLMLSVLLAASPHWRLELGKMVTNFQTYIKGTFLMPNVIQLDPKKAATQ